MDFSWWHIAIAWYLYTGVILLLKENDPYCYCVRVSDHVLLTCIYILMWPVGVIGSIRMWWRK
jgi:hypothetical protein